MTKYIPVLFCFLALPVQALSDLEAEILLLSNQAQSRQERLDDLSRELAKNSEGGMSEDEKRKALIQAERERLAKLPCPRIGMTKAQALKSCWGKPESVNRTTTAYSVSEQWVYGYGSYLYFTNGRLTAIQD